MASVAKSATRGLSRAGKSVSRHASRGVSSIRTSYKNPRKMNAQAIILIILIVAALVGIGVGIYFAVRKPPCDPAARAADDAGVGVACFKNMEHFADSNYCNGRLWYENPDCFANMVIALVPPTYFTDNYRNNLKLFYEKASEYNNSHTFIRVFDYNLNNQNIPFENIDSIFQKNPYNIFHDNVNVSCSTENSSIALTLDGSIPLHTNLFLNAFENVLNVQEVTNIFMLLLLLSFTQHNINSINQQNNQQILMRGSRNKQYFIRNDKNQKDLQSAVVTPETSKDALLSQITGGVINGTHYLSINELYSSIISVSRTNYGNPAINFVNTSEKICVLTQ